MASERRNARLRAAAQDEAETNPFRRRQTPPVKAERTTPSPPSSPTLSSSGSTSTWSPSSFASLPSTPNRPTTLTTPPTTPSNPHCPTCDFETTTIITASNENGNQGRPHWRCTNCNNFQSWADDRGMNPRNPPCWCEDASPSRLKAAGPKANYPNSLYYACSRGVCRYFYRAVDADGQMIVLEGDVIGKLACLGLL